MVRLSSVYNAINVPSVSAVNRHLPMLNSITSNFSNTFAEYGQIRWKKSLMAWYRIIPELTAFVNKVSGDTVARFHFEPLKQGTNSRNKILSANRFAQECVLGQALDEHMVDILMTGEAFGWLGFINKEQAEQIAKEYVDNLKLELKSIVLAKEGISVKEKNDLYQQLLVEYKIDGYSSVDKIDEDLLKPRKYRTIASSTMEVKYDNYDVLSYIQTVGVGQQKFDMKEIVRYTLMKRDGKVTGFTPVSSIIVQLELLRQMWQNQLSLHKNGGHPDKIFAVESNPNSPSFKRIEEELQSYKLAENKHKNMLWTGKVTAIELEQLDSMQFKDLGLYVTGLIAMQWGIPRSSIPYVVGGTNTSDDTGGNSERGYWETIRKFQLTFAETQNTQLWIPHFGVKIVFENPFVNYDVQREAAKMSKLQNILSIDTILMKNGKQLNLDKKMNLLELSDDEIEDAQDVGMDQWGNPVATGVGTQAQISKDDANTSDDKKNKNDKKRQEQNNTSNSRGMKPSGY